MKRHVAPGFPLGAWEYSIYLTEDLKADNLFVLNVIEQRALMSPNYHINCLPFNPGCLPLITGESGLLEWKLGYTAYSQLHFHKPIKKDTGYQI